MSTYHFHVTQIKRSKGQSAVACAAYRSGEKLYSDYYGEVSDYTRKRGIVHSEILLPSHAPPEYSDRQTLWNSVEKAEPHPKAQLAYSFDIALQNEFSIEENIALARQFLLENFVSRGMVCDFAVHLPDRKDGIQNPHFHVLYPMRPLDENGQWGAKQRREYVLDEHGGRLRDKSGEYVFNAVPTTDWGSPETLEHWRKAWCDLCNSKFAEKGLDERIDHRSYERQGVELLPTVHEGPTVRAMEKRRVATEKGSLNRWIKATNKMILATEKKVSAMKNWVSENRRSSLIQSLNVYNSKRNAGAYSQTAKVKNLKELTDDINFLKANGIESFDDLQRKLDELNEKIDGFKERSSKKSARLKEIDNLLIWAQHYAENKPVADELAKIKWKAKREKYQAESEMTCGFIIWQSGNFVHISRTANCQSARGGMKKHSFKKILRIFKISFRRCARRLKGSGKSNIKSNRRAIKLRKMKNQKGEMNMKFNKNGEKLQAQKKHNFRFDEEGHIIVQNPSAYWLPSITTKQTIGGTEYTVVAEFVGDEPLHKKLERIFENDQKLSL